MGVTDRTPQHAQHDPFLIAQHAADDLHPSERPRATEMIDGCRECASLAGDLRAIASATTALPPIVARRDFRLTDADAARLRRGAWRRRFGFLATPRFAFTQPLGLGLATIGLAGLLISGGAFGAMSTGGAASAPGAEVQAPVPAAGGTAGDSTVAASDDAIDSRAGLQATAAPATAAPAAAAPATAAPFAQPGASAAPTAAPSDSLTIMAAPVDGSPEPGQADTSVKTGESPAAENADGGAEAANPAAAATEGPVRDTVPTQITAPQVTAEGGPSWTGWLALILAGLAVAILRPIARRLTSR